jgi:cell division protein FtsB
MLRIACLLMLLLLAGLQYQLWWGTGGRADVDALAATVARQEAENAQLQQRNDALVAEVEDLKSGTAAVEERARTELGMVKPGETFYRIVDKQSGVRPSPP